MPHRRVTMVQYSADCNGSALSGLTIADGLRQAGWNTHVTFAYPGPMEQVYRESGHETSVVPHNNWLRRTHPARFMKDVLAERRKAREFEKLYARTKPDLVYVNTAVSLASALAARRGAIPTIWHLRELFDDVGGEMRAPAPARRYISRTIRGLATRIIANSSIVARNMLGQRHSEIAEVIFNCVDDVFFDCNLERSTARARFCLPQRKSIIGVPGTLRPVKGHSFFFQALNQLALSNCEVVAAITGDGEPAYVEELKKQLETTGLQDRVRMLGVVQDMPAFYRACDVVCVPSRSESFGRVVIEAFAMEVPVVATAVGAIPEFVADNVSGKLVTFADIEALAKELLILLRNPESRKKLSQEGHIQARRRFCTSAHRNAIQKVICNVFSNGKLT